MEFSGDRPGGAANGATTGESNTVFCGNMSFRSNEDSIRHFFGEVGNVTSVRIALNEEERPKGFCHIEFATPAEAAEAVKQCNGVELDGR